MSNLKTSAYKRPELSPMTPHRVSTAKRISFQIIFKKNNHLIKEYLIYEPFTDKKGEKKVARSSLYYVQIPTPEYRDCLGKEIHPDKYGNLPKCTIRRRKEEGRFVPISASQMKKYDIEKRKNAELTVEKAVIEINDHRTNYGKDYANTLKYS